MNYKVIPVGIDGTRSVQGNIGWYLVVLGHYKLVLLGSWWYRVNIGLLCLLNKVENWSGVTYASHTY